MTTDARAYPDQRRVVSAAFAPSGFDAAKRDNAPSLLLTADPLRVEWANAAAIGLFNADPARIAIMLAQPGNDMGTWAADALRRLPEGAPRLEKRRIAHRLLPRTLTLLCGRAEAADGRPALAVAILGIKGDPAHGSWQDPVIAADGVPVSGPKVEVPAAMPQRERLRFVWKTDVLGQVVQCDTGPLLAAGASILPAFGHRFAETVRTFDRSGAEQLASLLTPSANPIEVGLDWPATGEHAIVPVTLKATPWFDASRTFAGYRGFGLVDLARVGAAAPAASRPDSGPEQAGDDQGLVAEPHPLRQASDDTAPPASPAWADEKPYPVLANVVQFRPPGAVRLTADPADEAVRADDHPRPDATDGLARTPADVPRASDGDAGLDTSTEPDPLSSSEQEAFQEIGRTLQSGSFEGLGEDHGHDVVGGAGLSDVQRNAAAIIDATAAGLLIVRGPNLLFANQAVLDLLHYPTQADAEIGLGATLAQSASRMPDGLDHTIELPGQDGDLVRLGVRTGPIDWGGRSACLWTVRRADPPNVDQPRSGPERSVTSAPPHDLRDILNVAGEPIAVLDASGRIATLNVAAERRFGQRLSGAVGQDIGLLIAAGSRPAAAAALGKLAAGPGESLTIAVQTAADVPGDLDLRLTRIDDDRIAASWREPSLARRSADLGTASGERDQPAGRQPELLAKLSHQIRTPLNAIIGFTEVMMDERFGPLGNPRYKDYLQDVHASGAHVMSLVNDLLDLSRIEAGGHDLDLAAVDINRIIVEGVAQVQAEAHRARVIVRTAFSPRQPMIMADDGAARQIVANLLSNAIKFNEPGGQVIVSTTTTESGTVLVRIRDTGVGMSDRDIETALEPFRQLEPSRQSEASGLGLPLTKALVGANGASLSIRSKPGEGTMVEVTFQPAAAPARVPA